MVKGKRVSCMDTPDDDTIDNETFFNDLVEGLTSATNQLKEQNARLMPREMTEWVGRAPKTDEELVAVSNLRERALVMIGR